MEITDHLRTINPIVLVVASEPPDWLLVVNTLQKEYTIHVVHSFAGCRGFLQRCQPHTILIDDNLQHAELREMLCSLRHILGRNSVPIVCIGEQLNRAKVVDLLHAGATEYMTRSFDQQKIASRLRLWPRAMRLPDWKG